MQLKDFSVFIEMLRLGLRLSWPFVFWGFILTCAGPWVTPEIKRILNDILAESLASKTIPVLLFLALTGFSLYLTIFNDYRINCEPKKNKVAIFLENIFYNIFIQAPTQFLSNFLPAYIGILTGYGITLGIYGKFSSLKLIGFAIVIMSFSWIISQCLPYIINDKVHKSYVRQAPRLIGVCTLFFCIYMLLNGLFMQI